MMQTGPDTEQETEQKTAQETAQERETRPGRGPESGWDRKDILVR